MNPILSNNCKKIGGGGAELVLRREGEKRPRAGKEKKGSKGQTVEVRSIMRGG